MYIVYIQQVVKVLKNIYVINYKSNYIILLLIHFTW